MKMVKSLLLGSAAGLVAVVGAQAADLPVKARPVEYVKVCSLYGAGFFYAPGTDTCIKFGTAIRVQFEYNTGAGGIPLGQADSATGTNQGAATRVNTNDVNFRNRIYFSMDTRTQTEYGTLRSYFRMGIQQTTGADTSAGNVFWDRAFIQFAGFTVGHTQSFFDIYTYGGAQTYINPRVQGDTGPAGLTVFAYTAQFGNGFSATLSLEDPGGHNRMGVVDMSVAGAFPGINSATADQAYANQGAGMNGFQMPDIVGNLRADGSWGYAAVSGALHQVGAGYYQGTDASGCGAGGTGCTTNGHPSDQIGFAVAAGAMFNVPFISPGDKFGFNVAFAEGATGYTQTNGNMGLFKGGQSVTNGWASDAVYSCTGLPGEPAAAAIPLGACTGSIQLTTSWDAVAAFEHHWTPQLWSTLYGGVSGVSYNSTAQAIIVSHFAGAAACGVAQSAATTNGLALAVGNSCNPNYGMWEMGLSNHWNPHPDLDIGLEVVYSQLNTAFSGPVAGIASTGAQPGCGSLGVAGAGTTAATCNSTNQGVWSVMARWQRNFLP